MIELMVVISLIVILATIGLAQYRSSIVRAQEAVLKEDLFRMRDAIDQFYADKSEYPDSLESLVSNGYLRSVPEDPMTRSASTWQTVEPEPNLDDPIGALGVYDVKSGAAGVALDGTSYADW